MASLLLTKSLALHNGSSYTKELQLNTDEIELVSWFYKTIVDIMEIYLDIKTSSN